MAYCRIMLFVQEPKDKGKKKAEQYLAGTVTWLWFKLSCKSNR